MKIQLKGSQYSLTLSKKIIEAIGWSKGDEIDIKLAGKDKLELVRRKA